MNSENIVKPISISVSNILGEFEMYLRRMRVITKDQDLSSLTIGGLVLDGKADHVLSGEVKLRREQVEVIRLNNGKKS